MSDPEPASRSATPPGRLTAIVPAFDEAATIEATLRSLQGQTRPPDEIIVVDDCSSDATGDIARRCATTVLRPPRNTGSKAGAQSFALPHVTTELVMVVDADTVLEANAVELILRPFAEAGPAAASGFVLPRRVRTVWERGRYVEYLVIFGFFKQIQNIFDRPMIASGCFAAYRTEVVRACAGWSARTMAEDMDLTWTIYRAGHSVAFVPEALCYPFEPHDFRLLSRQLRRWAHGFIQNVRAHWPQIIEQPYIGAMVVLTFWDAFIATSALLILLPLLAIFLDPIVLVGYLLDWPFVAVPALFQSTLRREFGRACASLPCFYVLRIVNSWFLLRAAWLEFVRGRSLTVYEKGH